MEATFVNAFASELQELEKEAFVRETIQAIKNKLWLRGMKKKMANMTPEQKRQFFLNEMGRLATEHGNVITKATGSLTQATGKATVRASRARRMPGH